MGLDKMSILKKENDAMQQNQFANKSQSNAKEFELQQNINHISIKFKTMQKQNQGLKMKINQQKSSKQQIEKYNLRYQQKLSLIRKFCRSIIREIKNNKNEINYIKSSLTMNLERIYHEIQSSFNHIQSINENGIKRQLTKFKETQDLKLESMQQRVLQTALLSTRNMQSDANNDLNINQLQNEMDLIKNNLAKAKSVLSPKKIQFNKISLTSSLDSSLLIRNLSKKSSAKKVKKPSSFLRESCETATIRNLRNDLQSLECNYTYSKKKK